MTRKNEVIRDVFPGKERRLDYQSFMELMVICEEDYTGAKPFRRQFLFHRNRLEKRLAAAMSDNQVLSLLEFGNLTGIIKQDEDLSQLLYANPAWQYKEGINIPPKKSKNKRYKKVEGVPDQERGIGVAPNLTHNKAFIHKLDKAESMLDSFFS
mmetsp:Transcript_10925/g.16658  ORF Transcript_10925/g.16658 Transcript_10925/m.16658 type:complete len:154 (+) Transcript_10925:2375-2836(+)